MRHRGRHYLQISGYLSYTGNSFGFKAPDSPGNAAGHQAEKYLQPVWIRKGFEDFRESIYAIFSIIRHMSNLATVYPFVNTFFMLQAERFDMESQAHYITK